MKTSNPHARQALLGLAAALWLLLLAAPSFAGGAVPDAELAITGELRAGTPVRAFFDLKGYVLPSGAYASVNVRFTKRPDGPEPRVRTGYPETLLTFPGPGDYAMVFILNEVSKPSCGGVNAKTLLEKEVKLRIAE
ncbi:hypothetical protein [Pseudodesulfovibrio indicus]|nr:hypothetical protein [Pseudodesulfovibrio indicus]AMK10228.1 hypothetical protein AWY79_03380 [Pseudodesulfovibrio indicus]